MLCNTYSETHKKDHQSLSTPRNQSIKKELCSEKITKIDRFDRVIQVKNILKTSSVQISTTYADDL